MTSYSLTILFGFRDTTSFRVPGHYRATLTGVFDFQQGVSTETIALNAPFLAMGIEQTHGRLGRSIA